MEINLAIALKMRKGNNIAVAALARKLVVSIWYMLKGMFTPMIEITSSLETKMHKIASEIGKNTLKAMGNASLTKFAEEKLLIMMMKSS